MSVVEPLLAIRWLENSLDGERIRIAKASTTPLCKRNITGKAVVENCAFKPVLGAQYIPQVGSYREAEDILIF